MPSGLGRRERLPLSRCFALTPAASAISSMTISRHYVADTLNTWLWCGDTTYSDAWLSLAYRVEGLDLPMFQDCVRPRRYLGRIQRHARDAEGRGITVTPTLWINGHRINGLPPAEVLDSLVMAAFRDPSRRAGLQSER